MAISVTGNPLTAISLLGPGPTKNPATNPKTNVSQTSVIYLQSQQVIHQNPGFSHMAFPSLAGGGWEHVSKLSRARAKVVWPHPGPGALRQLWALSSPCLCARTQRCQPSLDHEGDDKSQRTEITSM